MTKFNIPPAASHTRALRAHKKQPYRRIVSTSVLLWLSCAGLLGSLGILHFTVEKVYSLPDELPFEGDAWTENDNSTISWIPYNYVDTLSWDRETVKVGSYSLKINHTGFDTRTEFYLDLKSSTDVSGYDFLCFWYLLDHSNDNYLKWILRVGDAVYDSDGYQAVFSATNGSVWVRLAIPLWAFIDQGTGNWTNTRYLTFYSYQYGLQNSDHSCIYFDGFHFATWETLSADNPIDHTYMANFYGFYNTYGHQWYSYKGKVYRSITDWIDVTTGESLPANLQNEALGQALYALGKAYEEYPSPEIFAEINRLGDWFCQFPTNNSYGAPPATYSNATGFRDTVSCTQAGWSLAGMSYAYKVTLNSTYKDAADLLRGFCVGQMWKGSGTGGFYDTFTISTGTASGTAGGMDLGSMLTGLGAYFNYVLQNSTVADVIYDLADYGKAPQNQSNNKWGYGISEASAYVYNGWFEAGGALGNSTIWDWGKRGLELWYMYGMSGNFTIMSESARHIAPNTACFDAIGRSPWAVTALLPTVVDLYVNRSLTTYKGAFEKCIWDWLRDEKTSINGIYFKETDLTRGWLCGNLFIWAAMAKYYRHLGNYTNPFVYTTNGTISDMSFGSTTMNFTITGSGTTITEVYCGNRGKPVWIAISGFEKPVRYDDASNILTITINHTDSSEIIVGWEIIEYSLSVNTWKNKIPVIANITLFDENKTTLEAAINLSSYNWSLPPFRRYYIEAATYYQEYLYSSAQIRVDLQHNTTLAVNFLFSNLTVKCLDLNESPLEGCILNLTRRNETQTHSTNDSGITTLEAYYGYWMIRPHWMGVPVGSTFVRVNASEVNVNINCSVGDLVVVVVNQYGGPIKSTITLSNSEYNLTLTGYLDGTTSNLTFRQIPLIFYTLKIEGEYTTQTYLVDSTREWKIRVEVEQLGWWEKTGYILIGCIVGAICSAATYLVGRLVAKRRRRKTNFSL